MLGMPFAGVRSIEIGSARDHPREAARFPLVDERIGNPYADLPLLAAWI